MKLTSLVMVLLLNLLLPVSYAEVVAPQVNAPAVTSPAVTEMPAVAPAVTPVATSVTPAVDASKTTDESAKKDVQKADGRKVVAHVVWVKGTFYATVPGSEEKRELKTSANIYMNDTLVTGAGSEAQIVFSDDSLMTFRAETKFYINQYNYAPKEKGKAKASEEKSVGTYVMDLIEGGFRTITGVIAKDNPDNYQVNTPVATIGVRGTEYSVVYTKDGQLFVKRFKGIPCVANPNSTDKQKSDTVCLNKTDRFAQVASSSSNPTVVAKEPNVFNVEVDIIPVIFSNNPVGYCGMSGCSSGDGGGSGFCIQ